MAIQGVGNIIKAFLLNWRLEPTKKKWKKDNFQESQNHGKVT
jgi:hypothetical protein